MIRKFIGEIERGGLQLIGAFRQMREAKKNLCVLGDI
jgi:hypothetical protein